MRYVADGIMEMDELVELLRLHEVEEGLGGGVGKEAGYVVRKVLEEQGRSVQNIDEWGRVVMVDEEGEVDAELIENIKQVGAVAVVVMRYGVGTAVDQLASAKMPGVVIGVVLPQVRIFRLERSAVLRTDSGL